MRAGVAAGFLAAVLTMVACTAGPVQQETTTGAELVVGAPLPLTGNLAREGALSRRGYDLWLAWANAAGGIKVGGARHKVRLVYADDQSNPELSGQLTEKLVKEDGARFLLASYGSTNTAADAAVGERLHVPVVVPNGAARAIFSHGYRYVFGVLSPADKYLLGVIDLAMAMNPKPATLAMLSADDSFSQEVGKGAVEYAAGKGLNVVLNQSYPNGSTNLYPLVTQAKAKNPDVLLNSGHVAEAIALHKAVRDVRLDAKVFAYSVGPATPDFTKALGPDADYVFTGAQWTPQVQYRQSYYISSREYVARYQEKYQTTEEPSYHVAESTAGGLALQKAIETAGSLAVDRVRDALAKLDFTTFYGRIKFDATGQNVFKPMVVQQVQSGRAVTVWPPEIEAVQPRYPTPSWNARLGPLPEQPKAKLPSTGAGPGR